jgi:hypothetical protein
MGNWCRVRFASKRPWKRRLRKADETEIKKSKTAPTVKELA